MARKLTLFKGVCYNSPRQTGCGNSSVVEHNLAKVGVAGSNPVSRSTFECGMWRRSQVAKAEVCKTSIQRFESARRPVSYTHLRAHETPEHLVCRLLLEKK